MKKSSRSLRAPDSKVRRIPHTQSEIIRAAKKRLSVITREFTDGFRFIGRYPRSVTFFGSARFKEDDEHYGQARSLATKLSKAGYAVMTGGGPGIMEAGNRGAIEGGGASIGINIKLPGEQVLNPYTTDSMEFYYFFSRKVVLSFSAEAYIFFPGGFGTLDEFFEIVTLVQTHKIPKVPIILVGSDYWKPLDAFIKKTVYEKHGAIDKADMKLYYITDDEAAVVRRVKKAPQRPN